MGFVEGDTVGSIYGRPLRRDEFHQAQREAHLRYFLNYREWPDESEMARQFGIMDRELRDRLLLIEKLNQLNVKVGRDAVVQWIEDVFKDPQRKVFNKELYDEFVKQRFPAKIGMGPREFEQFVRHELGVQHLSSVFGTAGKLVTPQEAEAAYRRENEQVDTKVVLVSSSNSLSKVNLDPAAIATFYTNQQAAYRIPERVQISYVKFDVTNFLAVADQKLAQQDTNRLSQAIDAQYQRAGPGFYKGPTGEPLSPDEAKQRIREDVRRETALVEAQKKATEFMEQLFDLKPVNAGNLDNLAAATGHQVAVSEPFSQSQEPSGLDMPQGFAASIFKLTFEEPFLEAPQVSEHAVYVVALKARHPSTQPPLEQVLERVTTDYQKSQARILANSAGAELQRNISAGLAQGKTFETAAAEAGAEVIDLPPFAQKTMSLAALPVQADLTPIKNIAFTLKPGELSTYGQGRDGGFVVHLEKRVPVTDEQVKAALPEYMKTVRQSRQSQAFSSWLRSEMELARITLATDKQTSTTP